MHKIIIIYFEIDVNDCILNNNDLFILGFSILVNQTLFLSKHDFFLVKYIGIHFIFETFV